MKPMPHCTLRLSQPLKQRAIAAFFLAAVASATWANDFQWLTDQAAQWVARQEGVRVDTVRFQPLDSRIQASPCSEALQIDRPFGGPKTLRIRCAPENWQVFLQRNTSRAAAHADARKTDHREQDQGAGQSLQTRFGSSVVRTEVTAEGVGSRSAPAGHASQALAPTRLKVVVAKQNLIAGQALEPESFAIEEQTIQGGPHHYFLQPEGLEFSELVRDIKAGEPIRLRDIRKALLVRRNQPVQFTISSSAGLVISVQLQSMDDGRIGEQIRLKNPESGKVLTGLVVGRSQARSL